MAHPIHQAIQHFTRQIQKQLQIHWYFYILLLQFLNQNLSNFQEYTHYLRHRQLEEIVILASLILFNAVQNIKLDTHPMVFWLSHFISMPQKKKILHTLLPNVFLLLVFCSFITFYSWSLFIFTLPIFIQYLLPIQCNRIV